MKKIIGIIILIISIEQTIGQGKFTYTPVNPKAGDEIEITYTLPDSIFYYPEAYVVKYIDKREYLFDLKLIKNGNHYSSKIKTDSNNNLLIFSFRNGGKWDNNSNNGNLIFIKANENQEIYSHLNAANFFNFYGPYRLGLNKNNKAALENYDIQFKKYPSTKNKYLLAYLNFLKTIDPIKTKLMVDSMINVQLINGLKTKDDFENIQELYGIIGDQSNIEKYKIIRLEKIALNIYDEKDLNQILLKEKDIIKKEQILKEISKNKINDTLEYYKLTNIIRQSLFDDYLLNKMWSSLKLVLEELPKIKGRDYQYLKVSNACMENSSNLEFGLYFAKQAVDVSKHILEYPSEIPNYMTPSEFHLSNKKSYGFYCFKYASLLIKLKMYSEAFKYSKIAALEVENGNNIEYNSLFATTCKYYQNKENTNKILERFIIEDKEDENIISILKANSKEKNFENYFKSLKLSASKKIEMELKKNIINEIAPDFNLQNIHGDFVKLSNLKGKIVIIDFWATWCTPCISSFPTMDRLVNQYKKDSSVAFLFINTFQSESDKLNVVRNFSQKNKYSFNILMDLDNNVSLNYEVISIPMKFIIGKDGNIKFKSSGFKGDGILKKEIENIIEILR